MDLTNSQLLPAGLALQLVQLSHPTLHRATGSGCGVAGGPRTVLDWWVATVTAERWHGLRAAQSSSSTSLAPACFAAEGRRNPPNPLHGTGANRYHSGCLRDYRGRVSMCVAAFLSGHCGAMEGRIWKPLCSSGLAKTHAEGEMAQDLPEKR